MHTTIQKWGNSLAVRIPKPFVEETHIASGSEVDLTIDNGKIIIIPQAEPEYNLKDLLKGVTSRNKHTETDTGASVGREIW
jgi:antitoxin MazE